MVRFLHTADWQIGKPYGRVRDPDHRARLRQVRIAAIARIAEVVAEHQAELVLVAGDLFDSPGPSRSDVAQTCSAIGAMGVPVMVIPGNHDHGGTGSLWHQGWFQQLATDLAPNLEVMLERAPRQLEHLTVLPCPLLRQAEVGDPCQWLQGLEEASLGTTPRVVLAHGSVHGFDAKDLDEGEQAPSTNRLRLEALPPGLADYVALGDWHGLKQVSPQAWYSGCPEQDRFPRSDDYRSAQVLLVDVERGVAPKVEVIATGQVSWHQLTQRLNEDSDLDALEGALKRQLGSRSGEDLLLLELDGQLSLQGNNRLQLLLDALESRLLRLKLRNRLRVVPDSAELGQLTERPGDPLVARVAGQLQRLSLDQGDGATAELAQLALQELSALCSQEP